MEDYTEPEPQKSEAECFHGSMNVETVRPAMATIDSSALALGSLRVSSGWGQFRNAFMALAENPYWVLLKAYSALPGGSKGCGGDDFSSEPRNMLHNIQNEMNDEGIIYLDHKAACVRAYVITNKPFTRCRISHHLQLVGFQYCLNQYTHLPAEVERHEKEGLVHVIGHKMLLRQQSHKQQMTVLGASAQVPVCSAGWIWQLQKQLPGRE
ncbi:hypothetical protein NC652_006824 [Populus alba x Populus x berolinensis]|nr:hypothetical protein NC652_006824 [Populus alba x Populus x berolinensis]